MAGKKSWLVPLAVLLIVTLFGCLLVSCNSKASASNAERFFDSGFNGLPDNGSVRADMSVAAKANASSNPGMASSGLGDFGASDPNGDEVFNPVVSPALTGAPSGSCFPRDRLTASELLPTGASDSRWAQANPAGQGDVSDQNFLMAGYHVGVNTTGSSKKNGNLQLRSEPANPQNVVSPWNNSTYEPDFLRKPLEIGENGSAF
jgi:hypothetical protein